MATLILSDLLDLDVLREHIAAGYVSERLHEGGWTDDRLGLRILNYTPKAQFDRVWDDVTRRCRGLIYREGRDMEVVARPWPKFYNYGEHVEGALDLGAAVEVTDKLDGSLGILYPTGDGYAVATRGSFDSDQARHATAVWRERYSDFYPRPGWTYLFEVVFPTNRVVVDYGSLDDLVLLGAVEVETGRVLGPTQINWPGPRARRFEFAGTLQDALALKPRPNAEGVVVRYLDSDVMVKVKQDDYVELHRIVTGLSERVVWERLGAGETVEDICLGLPDEFAEWVRDVRVALQFRADDVWSDVMTEYSEILSIMTDDYTRKDFAMEAADSPLAKYLFLLLDGKDIRSAIWREVKP